MKYLVKILLLIALLPAGNAWAALMGDPVDLAFECISPAGSNPQRQRCADSETYLSVHVENASLGTSGRVGTDFTFSNNSQNSLFDAIQIYFDSSVLETYPSTGISFHSLSGVDYVLGASPPNLEQGELVDFFAEFGAQPTSNGNRIDSGEELTVNLSLLQYDSFAMALMANDFRLGIRIFHNFLGGNESLVTLPHVVPIPVFPSLLHFKQFQGNLVTGRGRLDDADRFVPQNQALVT